MQFHLADMITSLYDFDFYTSNQEGIQGIQDFQLNPMFSRFLFLMKASFYSSDVISFFNALPKLYSSFDLNYTLMVTCVG